MFFDLALVVASITMYLIRCLLFYYRFTTYPGTRCAGILLRTWWIFGKIWTYCWHAWSSQSFWSLFTITCCIRSTAGCPGSLNYCLECCRDSLATFFRDGWDKSFLKTIFRCIDSITKTCARMCHFHLDFKRKTFCSENDEFPFFLPRLSVPWVMYNTCTLYQPIVRYNII